MSLETKIEWCDATLNPWIGCTKVSPGCARCYAAVSTPARTMGIGWGLGAPRRKVAGFEAGAKTLEERGRREGTTFRVFPSLCDWLDGEVDPAWFAALVTTIVATPHLDWLLLTKRPEKFMERMYAAYPHAHPVTQAFMRAWVGGESPGNVWVGVSAEDERWARLRLCELAKIPALVRFVSAEPLLGEIDPVRCGGEVADWWIVGGESTNSSGPARECQGAHIAEIVRYGQVRSKPVFVKQLGSNFWLSGARVPLKHPKGGDMAEWPPELRVREWPTPEVVGGL